MSACRQKYLNYAHSAVAFLVFFTLQPEIGRAFPFRYSFSGTHTRRDELRRFPLPLLGTSTTPDTYPTLPYLTLHNSPSREVDTIQERKSGTVRRTINIGKGTYLPTYLGTYMYLFGLQRMLKVGTGTSIPTCTLPTLGTLPYLPQVNNHDTCTKEVDSSVTQYAPPPPPFSNRTCVGGNY